MLRKAFSGFVFKVRDDAALSDKLFLSLQPGKWAFEKLCNLETRKHFFHHCPSCPRGENEQLSSFGRPKGKEAKKKREKFCARLIHYHLEETLAYGLAFFSVCRQRKAQQRQRDNRSISKKRIFEDLKSEWSRHFGGFALWLPAPTSKENKISNLSQTKGRRGRGAWRRGDLTFAGREKKKFHHFLNILPFHVRLT